MHPVSTRAAVLLGLSVLCVGARAGPAEELEALMKHCQAVFDQRPMTEVAYSESVGGWVKRQFTPVSIAVRMRKAISSVTPYIARIEITEVAAAHSGVDEASVRALDVSPDENIMRSVRHIHLAFQDGAWVPMGGASRVEVRRSSGEDFSPVKSLRYSRLALLRLGGPIASCLGQSPLRSATALPAAP
jgi:hypothetical protein